MRGICVALSVLLALGCGLPALAQSGLDNPPIILDVRFYIDGVRFYPSMDLAQEEDVITVEVDVYDFDFMLVVGDELHYALWAQWVPYSYRYASPEPPPLGGVTAGAFVGPVAYSLPAPYDVGTFSFNLWVPNWVGTNQARQRGLIAWDVRWNVVIGVSNADNPGEDEPIDYYGFTLYAVENPALETSNPPPFADAGADQLVLTGVEVLLDGGRTFDAYNIGFDLNDDSILARDQLTFTWEWISGPVRVNPTQTDPGEATATVTLDVPNDPDDPNDFYEYRLLVDDNVNSLPSADSVRIFVRDSLDTPHPPRAVIEGPANAQPVGVVVALISRSTDADDPDGSELEYRWQQTDELGDPLSPTDLQDAFLPLSGMTEEILTWQAVRAGTYHFRLLVDDGYFCSSARFSVEVIDAAISGAWAAAGSGSDDAAAAGQDQAGPALCGAGILPLAAFPLALCVMRRRSR